VEILVLHPGALGDIILSLPALLALRRRYPLAHLTVAADLDCLSAVAGGYADDVRSFNALPLHHIYSPDPLPDEDVRLWGTFDRLVSWFGSGDDTLRNRLAGLIPEVLVSSWRPGPRDKRHVARIFADSLSPWIPPLESIPSAPIRVLQERREEAREWLAGRGCSSGERLLALHPGAGSATKRWSIRNFRTLAHGYLQQEGKILIIEGPAEAGLGRELACDLASGHVLVSESPPLIQVAALLTCCNAYVGNDSGISHLAAGLGLPSVILFGPTSPEQWAPLGGRVAIIADSGLSRISPDRVWEALEQQLANERAY
jgi:ADP-heptose:LPS heptosyltransferase